MLAKTHDEYMDEISTFLEFGIPVLEITNLTTGLVVGDMVRIKDSVHRVETVINDPLESVIEYHISKAIKEVS